MSFFFFVMMFISFFVWKNPMLGLLFLGLGLMSSSRSSSRQIR